MVVVVGAARDALAVFSVVVLVAGFVAVGVLLWLVIRRAPPDGSDVGMAPDDSGDGPDKTG